MSATLSNWAMGAFFTKTKINGAGNEIRTRDFHLGKVTLYHWVNPAQQEQLYFEGSFLSTPNEHYFRKTKNMRFSFSSSNRWYYTTIIPYRGKPKNKNLRSINLLRRSSFWSGIRDSNSRLSPWEGDTLPAELIPQNILDILPQSLHRRHNHALIIYEFHKIIAHLMTEIACSIRYPELSLWEISPR